MKKKSLQGTQKVTTVGAKAGSKKKKKKRRGGSFTTSFSKLKKGEEKCHFGLASGIEKINRTKKYAQRKGRALRRPLMQVQREGEGTS